MLAKILDGNTIAAAIKAEVQEEVRSLAKDGLRPGLAVILAGHNPASEIYVRSKVNFCKALREAGAVVEHVFVFFFYDIFPEGKQIMSELGETDVTDETWAAKFKVMKESIEHHIEEEEGEMFPKARQAFEKNELEVLGARMLELKQLSLQETA